ncbi:MAG TPA: hypothetical protein VMT03_16870 [Polyangia bacterium]|nr:hypothetical protein [Polyangia bacterium]
MAGRFWFIAAVTVAAGCGGSLGTGGSRAAGGGSGTGGAGGIDVARCNQAVAEYATALSAELACTPGAPNQCQVLVGLQPTLCGGQTACGGQEYANDNTLVETARGEWLGACGNNEWLGCPVYACDPPAPPSTCVPTAPGASTGSCVPNPSNVVPDGGESCDQLAADYTAAVSAALACTPGAPNQCQSTLSPAVSACNDDCNRYLGANDTTSVTAIWQTWAAQCLGPSGCPGSTCTGGSVYAVCMPVDGGATGVCTTALQQ